MSNFDDVIDTVSVPGKKTEEPGRMQAIENKQEKKKQKQPEKRRRKKGRGDRILRDYGGQEILFEEEAGTKILDLKTFLSILHSKWRIFLLLIAAAMAIFALASYVVSQNTASCVMSLNYEESSKGTTPNGTRFNVSELRSTEVAELALEAAGLQGKIDPKEIADAISITVYANRSFVGSEEYYISSSYHVTFHKPMWKLREISAKDMLNLICQEYKDKFYREHIVDAKVLEEEEPDYASLDYSDIGSYFTLMSDRIDRYLDMRIGQAGSFMTQDGETFKSVKELVTNFRTYDLDGYNAYIWENGIAKDKRQQTETLTYLNNKLNWQYTEKIKENWARIATINEYNQAMTASILIPTYDINDEFYMSRTKTGIDDLAKDADKNLSDAKAVELEIARNIDKIEKLGQTTTNEQMAYAEQMVTDIRAKISDIIEKVILIDNEYIMQKTRNNITFEARGSGLITQLNVKGCLILGIVVFIVSYVFFVLKKGRKMRRYRKDGIEG